jgi:hypothetical protein
VPLSEAQLAVLRVLAALRDPESYVAGATPLNADGPRFSQDIDVFHDREERVAEAARQDADLLSREGFRIEWLRREPGMHVALVSGAGGSTRLEWARDSDFRFFPVHRDAVFGYRLHMFDLATNKALAAAGRREPRDILDLLHIHDTLCPLSAVIWAAVGKDPGFTAESLIAEIRRNARYLQDDFADLETVMPVDAGDVSRRFKAALVEAERFARAMPCEFAGTAFLEGGRPVEPATTRLSDYAEHRPQRRGHWPSSPDIGGAMLRR